MKYWLIPLLVCAGAGQAQAQGFISVSPSFIGVNINNPLLGAVAGVQFGQHNDLDVKQNSLTNFVGVQQVSIGKAGSSQSNTAGVTQVGNQSYTGLGQHIESLPPLPGLGNP
ncbi:hypothetical protein [Methylocystis echinoides]|uniref:hypothetical protein n=1 Tax=Methylocystis echinoides TaxID=29468 RepID=UPI00343DEE31